MCIRTDVIITLVARLVCKVTRQCQTCCLSQNLHSSQSDVRSLSLGSQLAAAEGQKVQYIIRTSQYVVHMLV